MADPSAALLPSVAPAGLPDDYQHIRADASSFGGEIAKGTEKLGAGLDQASNNLFNAATFYDKTVVDDQHNQLVPEVDRILRGDPTRQIPGPDGTMQPDAGYLGTLGSNTLKAREATVKAIDDRIEAARGNLTSPRQQHEFDMQTRRVRSQWLTQVSSHADGQYKVWTATVNDDSAKLEMTNFVNNLDNPEAMASHARDYIDFRVRNAQLKFGDDPAIVTQAVQSAKQDLLKAQVAAKEVNDPVAAMRILDKNREIAGTDYPQLAEKLRGRVAQQQGITDAHREVAAFANKPYASLSNPSYAAAAAATPGGMSAAGIARTVQLESSGDPNAGAGGAHVGLGQFSVDTALQAGVANRNDPEQSVRGIATLSAQNAPALQKVLGRQPSDAELYLAHQQGASGAAKLLANPDARAGDLVGDAAIRQNGGDPDASARAFTALWKSKFDKASFASGEMGNGATLAHQEGLIKSRILDDPAMNADPQRQNAALAAVGQIYAARRLQSTQDDAEFKLKVANSTAEALQTGAVQSPLPKAQFIATYGAAEGERAYADYQANIQLGGDMAATASMSPQQLEETRQRYAPQPGEEFISQSRRAEALDKAIRQNEALKAKDPAAFLISRTQEGAAAFTQFQATVGDPKATPQQRTGAAALYAEKMLAEQARLGVPLDARRVVPEFYTDSLTAKLNAPPDEKGQMPPIATILENEEKLWGRNWPAVTRQLGKNSAPVVRVLASGIKQGAAQTLQQLNGMSLPQILRDEDTEKNSTIKKDVLDAFKPFAASLAGNAGGLALFNDFRAEAEKLAAKYVIDGSTSGDAAKMAFESILGFKYTFQNGYRVPKDIGIPASDITLGTVAALRDLGKLKQGSLDLNTVTEVAAPSVDFGEIATGNPSVGSVKSATDRFGVLSPEYLRNQKINSLQRDGKWVTSPDESGLMLTHNDQAVRRPDGRAFVLSWQQLNDLSDQIKREIRDITSSDYGSNWRAPLWQQ